MPISRTAITDDDGTGTTGTVLGNAWKQEFYDQIDAALAPVEAITVVAGTCQGRLTLTTATPITTTDVTGATTIYFTPYGGNRIALYDGAAWHQVSFSELSLALGTLVNGQAYDVFAYLSSGAAAVEALEWKHATVTMTIATPCVVTWTGHGLTTGQQVSFTTTGSLPTGVSANTVYDLTTIDANTFKLSTSPANLAAGTFVASSGSQSGTHTAHNPQARQTALTTQDGVRSKNGDTTRRYLGTFYTTSTTTTEDSATKRYLWNDANRGRRPLMKIDATSSWTYSTNTLRQANNTAANQVECVIGVADALLDLGVTAMVNNSTAATSIYPAIGEDATATLATGYVGGFYQNQGGATILLPVTGRLNKFPAVGRHYYCWLENGGGSGTTTWYSGATAPGNSGLNGWLEG